MVSIFFLIEHQLVQLGYFAQIKPAYVLEKLDHFPIIQIGKIYIVTLKKNNKLMISRHHCEVVQRLSLDKLRITGANPRIL